MTAYHDEHENEYDLIRAARRSRPAEANPAPWLKEWDGEVARPAEAKAGMVKPSERIIAKLAEEGGGTWAVYMWQEAKAEPVEHVGWRVRDKHLQSRQWRLVADLSVIPFADRDLYEIVPVYTVSPVAQQRDESAARAALDGGEIWELLFGITKDNVPEELTDEVLNELANQINGRLACSS